VIWSIEVLKPHSADEYVPIRSFRTTSEAFAQEKARRMGPGMAIVVAIDEDQDGTSAA
jgi:hypothetical protein